MASQVNLGHGKEEILEGLYEEVTHTLLAYQSPTLGLFPRGESKHARVRDNVYCAMAIWSFALAYRHTCDDLGRVCELEQTAVKCMRGILFCYMRQAHKLEKFKKLQSWQNSLHAKFDCTTGDTVALDTEWSHLQIDGVALFLLVLAQMTASGLKVVLTADEIDFIQNVVYYIERAYRIPDFGMWERGTKENIQKRELHSSSLAMAKAALEAVNGLNLLGRDGSSLCVIHVDPDAHYRNVSTLNTLLPKESSSKDADAALLCVAGFPAFAIDKAGLAEDTVQTIIKTLQGTRGLLRFLKDIHHTVKEDKSKVEYERQELDEFAGIECEWPMFYIYIYLTAVFRSDKALAEEYWEKIRESLVVWQNEEGFKAKILPKYYYVPESEIDTGSFGESVDRIPSLFRVPSKEKMPFLWAQSLYLIGRLIRYNLLSVNELDPLGRHLPADFRHNQAKPNSSFRVSLRDTVVQVALISETKRLQTLLSTHGIPTQTQKQVEPIKIRSPSELVEILESIGANTKLGLSGRPTRPIGGLGACRVYHIGNTMMMFYPNEMELLDFYMSLDMLLLIDLLKNLLRFVCLHWNMDQRPTLCLFLRESIFNGSHFNNMISFLADLKNGLCNGVKIKLDRLQALIRTSCIERLTFLEEEKLPDIYSRSSSRWSLYSQLSGQQSHLLEEHDTMNALEILTQSVSELVDPVISKHEAERLSSKRLLEAYEDEPSLLGQMYILHELIKKHGENYTASFDGITEDVLIDKVKEIYALAGTKKDWSAVRYSASLLGKQVDSLSPSITAMVVRDKEVTIGVFNCKEFVINEPLPPSELKEIIFNICFEHDVFECVLQQELIIYLGSMIHLYPRLFDGMMRVRIGWIIQAMKNELDRSEQKHKALHSLAPNEVKGLLQKVLQPPSADKIEDYLYARQRNGALGRVPIGFYPKVYEILERVKGGLSVRGYHLTLAKTSIADLHKTEKRFAIHVEEMLGCIGLPEYRQVIVELLMVIYLILSRNKEVVYNDTLDLDVLLVDAIQLYTDSGVGMSEPSTKHRQTSYICHQNTSFYAHHPTRVNGTASFLGKAVANQLLGGSLNITDSNMCAVS